MRLSLWDGDLRPEPSAGAFVNGELADRQVIVEPCHRRAEVDLGQMHDQVDGTTATASLLPVHELRPPDRQGALFGVPFSAVPAGRRTAPRRSSTLSSGSARTAAARRRRSSKVIAARRPEHRRDRLSDRLANRRADGPPNWLSDHLWGRSSDRSWGLSSAALWSSRLPRSDLQCFMLIT